MQGTRPASVAGFALLLTLACIRPALANDYFTLYGYKIGQSISMVQRVQGKPALVHRFDDGWTAYSYRFHGYNVHFETLPSQPDTIISIQIEGDTNPEYRGLGRVNRGDSAQSALQTLGPPAADKTADDLVTGEAVANTRVLSYNGFSLEERDGKVSSIKIVYAHPRPAASTPDYPRFFRALADKDYYRLAEMISFTVERDGTPLVTTSMVDGLQYGALHNVLYDAQDQPTVSETQMRDEVLRVVPGHGAGHVARFRDSPIHELVFTRTFEGLVLTEIQ